MLDINPLSVISFANDSPKSTECSKSISRRDVYSNKAYISKQKSQINNLILYLKELQKEEQTKLEVSRRKEIIKIKAEINERDQKQKISMKLKVGSLKNNKSDKPLAGNINKN